MALDVQGWGGCGRRCAPASTATSTSCGRCSANNPPASGTTTDDDPPPSPPARARRRGGPGSPPPPLLLGAGWRPTAARSDLMSPGPSTQHRAPSRAELLCSALLCSVDSDRQRAAVAAGQVLSEFSAYSRQLMMTIMILVHVHPLLI